MLSCCAERALLDAGGACSFVLKGPVKVFRAPLHKAQAAVSGCLPLRQLLFSGLQPHLDLPADQLLKGLLKHLAALKLPCCDIRAGCTTSVHNVTGYLTESSQHSHTWVLSPENFHSELQVSGALSPYCVVLHTICKGQNKKLFFVTAGTRAQSAFLTSKGGQAIPVNTGWGLLSTCPSQQP